MSREDSTWFIRLSSLAEAAPAEPNMRALCYNARIHSHILLAIVQAHSYNGRMSAARLIVDVADAKPRDKGETRTAPSIKTRPSCPSKVW